MEGPSVQLPEEPAHRTAYIRAHYPIVDHKRVAQQVAWAEHLVHCPDCQTQLLEERLHE